MEQYLWFCLQENNQIRGRNLSCKKLEDLLIQSQLMVIQVQRSKNPVLVKEIVTKGDLVKKIELRNLFLLLETVQQKEDLGLKGIFFPILVEIREERVLLRFFKDTPGIKFFCQKPGETRFPTPIGPSMTIYRNIIPQKFVGVTQVSGSCF